MFTKSSILVTLLFAAVILAANAVPSPVQEEVGDLSKNYIGNNLIVGDILNATRLLARQIVWKDAQEGRAVISTVTVNAVSTITYLTVLEERSEVFFSAWPVLIRGGPGSTSATLFFTSWPGNPISFVITAYGNK